LPRVCNNGVAKGDRIVEVALGDTMGSKGIFKIKIISCIQEVLKK
jgi:hypothetical protein